MSFTNPNNPMPNLTFSPTIQDIAAISQTNPCIVTTISDHDFVVGQQVQFFIPQIYGMQQLANQTAYVTAITDDTFTIPIDATFFDAFAIPSLPDTQVVDPPQVAPIGDANTGTTNPGGVYPIPNTVPGSFREVT